IEAIKKEATRNPKRQDELLSLIGHDETYLQLNIRDKTHEQNTDQEKDDAKGVDSTQRSQDKPNTERKQHRPEAIEARNRNLIRPNSIITLSIINANTQGRGMPQTGDRI